LKEEFIKKKKEEEKEFINYFPEDRRQHMPQGAI